MSSPLLELGRLEVSADFGSSLRKHRCSHYKNSYRSSNNPPRSVEGKALLTGRINSLMVITMREIAPTADLPPKNWSRYNVRIWTKERGRFGWPQFPPPKHRQKPN